MTEHIPASRRRPAPTEPNPLGAARKAYAEKFGKPPGPRLSVEQIEAKLTPSAETAAPAKRRRRASVGGMARKLDAPTRPGFVRRFFNDIGNRLATAADLGYEFVEEPGVKTSDPSSRINRLAGTQPNGAPLKTYLMETPDELYAEGVAEKEALNRQIDDAITAGVDSTGQLGPKSETYGHGSIERDR